MRHRLALGLAFALAGCSSGGSDDSGSVPLLPWGSFRHDLNNSAVGTGIFRNTGEGAAAPFVSAAVLGGITASTPAIDDQGNIYIGTNQGLVGLDADGTVRFRLTECVSMTDGSTTPIGSVTSSPTATPGDALVFGSDFIEGVEVPGAVFAFEFDRTSDPICLWAMRPPDVPPRSSVRSSPAVQVDPLDLSLLTVVVGSADGRLLALNSDGTLRWSYARGTTGRDLSSSPALNATNAALVTTPDGVLAAIDFSGRLLFQVPIGEPPPAVLHPSPAVATTTFAVGGANALVGINPDGTLKWRFIAPAPLSGSPAFLAQTFDQGDESILDTIVYTVDVEGTVRGVRDSNGMIVQLQRCSLAPTTSCQTACDLSQETCETETQRCSITGAPCDDSCQSGNGTCELVPGVVSVADEAAPVATSPALSADFFVVVGTGDGRLCARALDGNVPGDTDDPENPWLANCLTLGAGLPTRSSPVIGRDGVIFVTTDEGLFAIE